MMKKQLLAIAAMALCAFATSCSKDDNTTNDPNNPNNPNTGKSSLSMYLTDGPGDYDAVYLDIQSVEVTMDGQSPVTLNAIRPGIYDLLKFSNGTDTLLARADVPSGSIEQIRLILGSNNSVVVNNISYPLITPSGQTSGIKLNLHDSLVAGNAYNIWIDFDAAKSIHQTGNGKYMLKPVVRAYSALTNGRIKGFVLPLSALATVYAINGVDTFSAIPEVTDGFFLISGLPQANYNVLFDAGDTTLKDTMYLNVPVTFGVETNLGAVTLVP
ncbi:DUF4382 domain-containing protein [Polluticoccus soli]|uniref:DUF4382 domain-containing protein n=1 Tax=Polluticoccus soli TaxID=3034150 RepID=UPI0023E2D35E|nr:DUF4382 domain-containing protein [Flavipsychrobacter sp. JY13-12]